MAPQLSLNVRPTELVEVPHLGLHVPIWNKALEVFLGSGAALALGSGVYLWFIKGRVKIPKFYDVPHVDARVSRHRIRIRNKGRKTLQNLVCHITFSDLNPDDLKIGALGPEYYYLVSNNNFVPICDELIIWDTGEKTCDLHPKQEIDVDILHCYKNHKAFIIPSEQGYTKLENGKPIARARACISNSRTYSILLRFYANDYRSKAYRFLIKPDDAKDDVIVEKMAFLHGMVRFVKNIIDRWKKKNI